MARLNLAHLETVCWIDRLGSFTAAAERLNMTQPAISRRVQELEDRLQVKLFHRQGRRMTLTLQGRDLVKRAGPLLNELDNVVVSLENTRAASGTLRMGVGEIVALGWFPGFIARLQSDLPNVTYEVEVGLTIDMQQKLEHGALDLAIVAAPLESSRIASTYLGTVQVQWLASRASLRGAAGRTARQLFESQPVWCVARPAHMHEQAVRALRRHGVAPGRVNTCDNLQALVGIVATGAGVALLPADLLRQPATRERLVPLSRQLPPEGLDFYLASHRDQKQALLRHVMEVAVAASTFERR